MKKLTGVAFSIALVTGLALYIPCGAADGAGSGKGQSSMSQSTGGATGGAASSGTSVQQSTGGATGATGGQDMNSLKKSLNNRVKAVDKEISSAKKGAGNLPADQKDAMQLQIDQVQAKRDSVKKMISDMKRADERNTVETAMADLEQSAKNLSSSTQRSMPAGDTKSGSSSSTGGATGGSGMSQSTGGATGGAAPTMDLNALKKGFNDRVDKVGRDLKAVQTNIKGMSGTQKDTMQMELDKVMAKEAAAKKIISDMKNPSEQREVESAVADLEQSAKKLEAQTKRTSPAGQSSAPSSSGGGATGGSSMSQSTGGATGGTTPTMDLNAMKKGFNDRIDKATREINDVKTNMKSMTGAKKDTMQMELDKVTAQRDAAKKMVSDMKNPGEQAEVESAISGLEQSAQKLSTEAKRTSPAGDSSSTGGATGGSSSTAVNESTGGMTGGSAGKGSMNFSYDQRAQFKKTANTKLDSLDKRINMLKENAKMAPQDVNSNVMPKVDQLTKMSNDVKSKINKVDNSDRQAWNTTRTDINDSLGSLESSLMDAEKTIS